jgi:hypothetical protein
VPDFYVISRRKAEELAAALFERGAIKVEQVDAIVDEARKIIRAALEQAAAT